jgi:phytoene desaturase
MKVVVVGAGLGGLAAAAHLVGRGHDVTVVEQSTQPGGRAGVVTGEGYVLDNGPTVLTMPGLLADTFAAAGADMADFVTIRPVDPMYRAVYADGSELRLWHDRSRMTAEIEALAGAEDAEGFERFCRWLTRLYEVEMPHFIDTNFDSPVDLIRPLAPALRLVRLGGFRRLERVVRSYFRDERLRRIFSFQSMYAGLAPYEALALFAVITYMDAVEGVYAPEGGMHRLAAGLANAVEKTGAHIRYGAPVGRILRAGSGAVTGVELVDGEERERVPADAVVCNADIPVAYRELLGGVEAPRAARRGAYSPSCALWVAGVRGEPPARSAHHNLHFGTDWAGAFRAVIDDGTLMPDPSVLVTVPSRDDSGVAPEGSSCLYVLEPTPNLDGRVDWVRERERVRAALVARIAGLGYPVDVEIERFYDPLDWEAAGMERGTPFSLAHTFRQTGPFRPTNVDRRVPGLVFTGSGTVPGVGVPMVLISGRLAADRVDELAATGRAGR